MMEEQARAGETGAGFAVVADEVRSLAMRAAEATRNTDVLIDSIVKQIQESTKLVDTTAQAFYDVTESSDKVAALLYESGEIPGQTPSKARAKQRACEVRPHEIIFLNDNEFNEF